MLACYKGGDRFELRPGTTERIGGSAHAPLVFAGSDERDLAVLKRAIGNAVRGGARDIAAVQERLRALVTRLGPSIGQLGVVLDDESANPELTDWSPSQKGDDGFLSRLLAAFVARIGIGLAPRHPLQAQSNVLVSSSRTLTSSPPVNPPRAAARG